MKYTSKYYVYPVKVSLTTYIWCGGWRSPHTVLIPACLDDKKVKIILEPINTKNKGFWFSEYYESIKIFKSYKCMLNYERQPCIYNYLCLSSICKDGFKRFFPKFPLANLYGGIKLKVLLKHEKQTYKVQPL